MESIGERVNYGNPSVRRELVERFLRENTRDDSVDPAVEAFRDIGYRFTGTQAIGDVVEKNGRPAEARDSHLECDPRAQRGLFENQGERAVGQRSTVAFRAGLQLHSKMEQFADLRSAPFHTGEEIGS